MEGTGKAVLVALVLAMMLCVSTAFAATITVQNIVNGQTYTAYKLLNYTATSDGTGFSYYLTAAQYGTSSNKTPLATVLENGGLTFSEGTDGNWYVSNASAANAANITTALKNAISNNTFSTANAIASKTVQAANDAADFGDLATG